MASSNFEVTGVFVVGPAGAGSPGLIGCFNNKVLLVIKCFFKQKPNIDELICTSVQNIYTN